jgi:hypothetical protein
MILLSAVFRMKISVGIVVAINELIPFPFVCAMRYFCLCSRCAPGGKWLSRATMYRHKDAREGDRYDEEGGEEDDERRSEAGSDSSAIETDSSTSEPDEEPDIPSVFDTVDQDNAFDEPAHAEMKDAASEEADPDFDRDIDIPLRIPAENPPDSIDDLEAFATNTILGLLALKNNFALSDKAVDGILAYINKCLAPVIPEPLRSQIPSSLRSALAKVKSLLQESHVFYSCAAEHEEINKQHQRCSKRGCNKPATKKFVYFPLIPRLTKLYKFEVRILRFVHLPTTEIDRD